MEVSDLVSRPRGARRRTRGAITTAAALAVAAAFAGPAGAAVTGTHVIAALPDSSGLELSGYPHDTTLAIALIRNGVTISTGSATTDAAGDGAINGGGTDCWTGVTPDILPGDTVQVTGGGFVDSMVVQGTTADVPVQTAADTVVVHGTASDSQGNQLPVTGVEARITSKTLFSNGKRVLRAGTGNPFLLSYDTQTGTAWTATFSGLSASDVQLATHPLESRGVFTNAAANESTISQNPGARGPTAPCTAPLLRDAVTSSSPSAVNIAHAGSSLVLAGVAQDATAVDVSLDDDDPSTAAVTVPAVTPSPATGAQTWTATIPASSIAGLRDGTLTASATYDVAGGTIGGASLRILKDLVAPDAPSASPSPGTYPTAQVVRLSQADAGAAVHWTSDGSTPTEASPVLAPGAGITVSGSQTIRTVAIDPAGNAGPVGTFAYTIAPPGAGGGGSAAAAVPGATPVIQRIQSAGAARGVLGAQARRGALVVRALSVAVLRGRALRVTMRVPSGAGVVRVRVFRARNGRPSGAPLVTALRLPAASGRYVVTLRARALRALRRGRPYVLEVRAGTSRSSLGSPTRRVFRVR
jgi:Chitobiase/beta-hexosaminidase C-terminal domain